MRTTISILLLLATTYCHGQFSISAGASRIRENLFNNDNAPFFGQHQRHLYNCFTLQADYTKSFFRTYTELGYLPASFEVTRETYYSHGGGSSQIYANDNVYHSKVNFTYFTVKCGVGSEFKKLFKKNWWSSFSFNVFAQYERLIDEKTSENVRYQTITQSGTTTVHPPNYYSPSLVSFEDNIFQFGVELKERLGFQNYFVEFSTSLSSSNVYRSEDVNVFPETGKSQSTNWGLNTSLKLGYYFARKPKKDN
jgi:hypothetical protein